MNEIATDLENARDGIGSIALQWHVQGLIPLDNEHFKDRLEHAIASLCRVRAQMRKKRQIRRL
jgi:hypothetical protein